ncbi:putative agmatine deiminase [Purpureocillium lavendulum]|uniref:Agmatine deiminase n=1 Tax=Purpureocillium lavendulum TaxID=1247861 RepID=A0AB34FXI3_9HYPO|nr:putative agmatine deiminase [Purpureocillium lavendulum]
MAHVRVASQVFHRPAEWVRHARTILAWPGSETLYYKEYPGALASATREVSAIAAAVARFEPVTLIVERTRLAEAQKRFAPGSTKHKVDLHPIDGDQLDLWMRDIAPTFTVKKNATGDAGGVLCGVDFNFNGWGNKFRTETSVGLGTETCVQLARTLLKDLKIERIESPVVTEGGAIEVDGEGTLVATESSIINDNRNPGMSREDIEAEFSRTLGIEKFIWIPGVKDVEVTDCHIDAFARFARPGVVLLSKPSSEEFEDADSVWVRAYKEAVDILAKSKDAKGRSLEVIEISEPNLEDAALDEEFLEAIESNELPPPAFNYANYLLVNRGLIFPQFGDRKSDAAALATIKRLFGAERQIVTVPLQELPLMGGGIHCATQEIPWTPSFP